MPRTLLLSSKKKAQVDGHLIQQKQKLAFANNTHTPPLLPHHHPDNFQPPKTLFKMLISKENRRAIYESLFKGEQEVFSQVDLVSVKELTWYLVVLRVWLDHNRGRHGRRKGL